MNWRDNVRTFNCYITVYLPSGTCHSDVTSLLPPLPLLLISRLDARTGSAVPNCLAARTRFATHFFCFLRSCGDVTFLCVGPPYERNIRRYHVKKIKVNFSNTSNGTIGDSIEEWGATIVQWVGRKPAKCEILQHCIFKLLAISVEGQSGFECWFRCWTSAAYSWTHDQTMLRFVTRSNNHLYTCLSFVGNIIQLRWKKKRKIII